MSTALRASARRQLVQLLVERALRDLRAHNASPGQAADPDHDDARRPLRPLLDRPAERELHR